MSLYTNSVQKSQNEQRKKSISNRKFILKDAKTFSMKNLLIQIQPETKKELILPKAKNVLSRNQNGPIDSLLSPTQSDIKNFFFHIKKFNFQSSRDFSKPKSKQINNTKLTKFIQRNPPNIKILKSKQLEKIHKTKNTYDIEVSEIKNKKYSFGGFNFNSNKKVNELNDKLQKDNVIIENNNIDTNDEQINIKSENENKIEKNKEVNENKENVNNINTKPKIEEVKKLNPIINNKTKKDKLLLNKLGINNKVINKNKNKKVIIDLKPLDLKENKNNEEKGNLASLGKEKIDDIKFKRNKFGILFYNKKINKVYSKIKFLNEINEELTENLINKRINTKLFAQKENLLINAQGGLENIIFKENTKIIKHGSHFLSSIELKNVMQIYFKEIALNKNKIKIYKERYIYILTRKINYKFNCIIGSVTRDYIFKKYESNAISLSSKNKINDNNNNNLIKNFKKEKKIKTLKKSQTVRNFENTQNNKNNSENFSVDKTKDVKLRYKKNIGNFIIIQEFILKSLPFYKENYIRLINIHKKHKVTTRRHANLSCFDKNHSKKFLLTGGLDALSKKNSFNVVPFARNYGKRRADRRSSSIFNLDGIKQTLRINLQKTESRESNFSVLKQKNFFKKFHTNNENILELGEKESSKSLEKEKTDVNEADKEIQSLYFQLIKALFEGKIKNFKNLYMKNKKFIDINQVLIEGNTLLILAAREGNYQITKFLCEEKADINIQNTEGNTALHYAIGKQFYSIADILTMHGAKEDLQNFKGLTPWDCIEHNVD